MACSTEVNSNIESSLTPTVSSYLTPLPLNTTTEKTTSLLTPITSLPATLSPNKTTEKTTSLFTQFKNSSLIKAAVGLVTLNQFSSKYLPFHCNRAIKLASISSLFFLFIFGGKVNKITTSHSHFFLKFLKSLLHEISLGTNRLGHKLIPNRFTMNYSSEITKKITLGALPLMQDLKKIIPSHQAVLSIVEESEMAPSIWGTPISKNTWEKHKVIYKNIPSPDRSKIKLNLLKEAVAFIEEQINNNNRVYVHCKHGIGRSATVVLCYLISTNMSIKNAIELIRNQRFTIFDFSLVNKYIEHKKNILS